MAVEQLKLDEQLKPLLRILATLDGELIRSFPLQLSLVVYRGVFSRYHRSRARPYFVVGVYFWVDIQDRELWNDQPHPPFSRCEIDIDGEVLRCVTSREIMEGHVRTALQRLRRCVKAAQKRQRRLRRNTQNFLYRWSND